MCNNYGATCVITLNEIFWRLSSQIYRIKRLQIYKHIHRDRNQKLKKVSASQKYKQES